MRLAKVAWTVMYVTAAAACCAQTADEVVAKNLAARGGAEKLRAIQTMLMTGTIRFGDSSSPITVKVKRPDQIREEFQIQGTTVVRAFDGATGWDLQKKDDKSQVTELTGGELNNIKEEAENAIDGLLLDYAKRGSKVEALGKDSVDGKPAFKLRITTHLGTGITQYFDAANYLEIHEEIERWANGKLITIVEDVGDYRDVGGVKFPHLFVSGPKENPKATSLQIEKMQLNMPIAADEFKMPESQKAEVRMQKLRRLGGVSALFASGSRLPKSRAERGILKSQSTISNRE